MNQLAVWSPLQLVKASERRQADSLVKVARVAHVGAIVCRNALLDRDCYPHWKMIAGP